MVKFDKLISCKIRADYHEMTTVLEIGSRRKVLFNVFYNTISDMYTLYGILRRDLLGDDHV